MAPEHRGDSSPPVARPGRGRQDPLPGPEPLMAHGPCALASVPMSVPLPVAKGSADSPVSQGIQGLRGEEAPETGE